jgi:hypothetical protein
MKQVIRISLTSLAILVTSISGRTVTPPSNPIYEFPEKVSVILSNSCYDCHTTGTKAEKAVKALDFKKWDEYKLTKKISLLTNICDVLEKGEMPPEKYLGNHPEKKLSEDELELICNWTRKETENLINQ